MTSDVVPGAYHCVRAVLRPDSVPEPDDLQSEEQGSARVYPEDSEQLQTCCRVPQKGRLHSVLTATLSTKKTRVVPERSRNTSNCF